MQLEDFYREEMDILGEPQIIDGVPFYPIKLFDTKQVEMKTTKSPSLFLGYLHETGPQRQRWTLELRLKAGCQRGITYVKVCSGNDQMP